MPSLSLMLKTVSGCNASCGYCYTADGRAPGVAVMEEGLAIQVIAEYMAFIAGTGQASLGWQGGEPTLAGVDFFVEVLAAEARHAPDHTVISNDLQTNGLLVDDAFAELFAAYRFLVGLSIDGPRSVHDAARRDTAGRGTFDRAMAAFERMASRGVEVNALCVVGPHNVGQAVELLRFYVGAGLTHLQVMPAMGFAAYAPEARPDYLVTAAAYGQFLVELFDAWLAEGAQRLSVQVFDDALRASRGLSTAVCTHAMSCEAGLVVDTQGEVFPCDFYQSSPYGLGNVRERSLAQMALDPRVRAFAARKEAFRETCRACPHLAVCRGGCPRNRPRPHERDTLCQAYRLLFDRMAQVGFL